MPDQVPKGTVPATESADASARGSSVLVFRAGSQLWAVAAVSADEVVDWTPPRPLPHLPGHIAGVIFQRGQAVALVDLAEFLGLDGVGGAEVESEPGELVRRVVIVSEAGMRVGLICHQVLGLMEFGGENTEPVAASQASGFARAQLRHSQGLVKLLDLGRLLAAAKPPGRAHGSR